MSRFSSAIHSAGRSPVAAANRIIGPYRPPSAATASSSLANPPRCTRLEPRPPTRYRYAQSGACSRPGRLSSNTWPCWIIAILLDRQPTEECHRVAAATTSLIEGWSFGSEGTLWPSEFSRRLGACDGCEPRRSRFLDFSELESLQAALPVRQPMRSVRWSGLIERRQTQREKDLRG